MNIIPNYSTPNFEARIKLRAPDVKQLTQSMIGTAALGTATVCATDAAISSMQTAQNGPEALENLIVNANCEILNDTLGSQKKLLTSAGGRYDAAGYMPGVPVQATIFPSVPFAAAIGSFAAGSNACKLASGDNIQATTLATSNLAMNKNIQKTVAGTGILATAAGSLYSGIEDLNEVNQHLPESIALDKDSQTSMAHCGASTVATPAVGALSAGVVKSSNTKSSNFVVETLKGVDSDKKLPS